MGLLGTEPLYEVSVHVSYLEELKKALKKRPTGNKKSSQRHLKKIRQRLESTTQTREAAPHV